MKIVRTIIVDDEPNARALVKLYCNSMPEIEIIAECEDGFSAAKQIQLLNPDLIFLDVQMPRLTGFEMLELIPEPPYVIFTTAYDEFALKAFEFNAIDYLLKPFSIERFQKSVRKVLSKVSENRYDLLKTKKINFDQLSQENCISRVAVRVGNEIKVIAVDDILRLEACDDYVIIHTQSEQFIKESTLKYFETHLDSKEFVRVHRSHIVKIAQINKFDAYQKDGFQLLMKNGDSINVSKSGYKAIKEVLNL